jgi:hypothetical protein
MAHHQQLDSGVMMVTENLAALGLNPIDAEFGAESAFFSIKKEKVLMGLDAVVASKDMERAYGKAYSEAKRISAHRETLESETVSSISNQLMHCCLGAQLTSDKLTFDSTLSFVMG